MLQLSKHFGVQKQNKNKYGYVNKMSNTNTNTNTNYFHNLLQSDDLVAAPLAGVTNRAFRNIIRNYHSGLMFTEMISVEGLVRQIQKTLHYLSIDASEGDVHVQLFGMNPESFSGAVHVCEDGSEGEHIKGYNVNMGCPAKKVYKKGGGAGLLRDTNTIAKICQHMRKSTTKPISIKIRLGWDNNNMVYREILNIAENEGVNALIVHARTRKQMFTGEPVYSALEELAQDAKNVALIGNGNVFDRASYLQIKNTGVQGVMIGRGMMKKPWIFQAIKAHENPDTYLAPKEIYNLLQSLAQHETELATRRNDPHGYNLALIKKYAVWFSKGLANSAEFRGKVYAKMSPVEKALAARGGTLTQSYHGTPQYEQEKEQFWRTMDYYFNAN